MYDGDLVMMIMIYFDDDGSDQTTDQRIMAMAAVCADVLLLKLLALPVAVVVVDSAAHIPASNATRRGLGRCRGGSGVPW